jgi:hypothetical protein
MIIVHWTFPTGESAVLAKAKPFAGRLTADSTALEKATKIPVSSIP